MSEPTRYRVANNQAQLTLGGGILAVDPAGPLVEYADYARLKAEVEELTHDANEADQQYEHAISRVRRLEAEVERLRKWMDDISLDTEGRLDSGLNVGWTLLKIKQEYNAAKEGKQP